MSHRTWIGPDDEVKRRWADTMSCDYPDIVDLANAVKWKLPAKLYFHPDYTGQVQVLLKRLKEEHSMHPDEFWCIGIIDNSIDNSIEHPTEAELSETRLGFRYENHATLGGGGPS